MPAAHPPKDESERLARLRALNVLDTPAEARFDQLTRVAAFAFGTPIALVSLVDDDRQWFKSRVGLEAEQTPRASSFCAHSILEPTELLVVEDARADERFVDNPLVTGPPNIRFYAGSPLLGDADHSAIGTLCVIDTEPRTLSPEQRGRLGDLGALTANQLTQRALASDISLCVYCRNVAVADDWFELETFLRAEHDRAVHHAVCGACYRDHVVPSQHDRPKPE